ncbi:cytochrome P450 [Leucogyrophana mollusca]|uniref:Cytochrome P450 n=1 Tax=Leucogyrophana mollusca TaxID=85980 RepID=A0ACB8BSS3_9AGAM|nr:cytochrome P450 [Leucogyrophana mollusca]
MFSKGLDTPGILFLRRPAFYAASTIVGAILCIRFVSKIWPGIPLSLWLVLLGISLPLSFAGRVKLRQLSTRRAAASIGARPIPCLQGKRVGNVDLMFKFLEIFRTGYPGDGLDEVVSDVGTIFNTRMLFEDDIITIEPNHIKALLATDFDNFEKGDKFRATTLSLLGTGIFNSDGEMWKFHRSMTRPFFTHDRISHFNIFDRCADEAIPSMKARFRAGHAVDLQDLMLRFTLDSSSEFLFGHGIHSLRGELPYPHNTRPEVKSVPDGDTAEAKTAEAFARAFAGAQYAISQRFRMGPMWPLFEISKDNTKEHMEVVNAYIEPILQNAINKQKARPSTDDASLQETLDEDTLLDYLVRRTTDITILRDEVVNIMTAARDTTASTLTFTLYFLATHPQVYSRLREEVLTKVGSTSRPTYDNIRDMKYLRAVINESMRLFPAVPFNVRDSIKATTLPSPNPAEKPLYVPARTSVTYSALLMHRRKDLWGPDAEEYDPDRFLDERLRKYLTPNPYIFLPFNAGPRICIGQQFAYNEISFIVIRLLQNFTSMTLSPEGQAPETRPPAAWASAEGRKAIEKICPRMHVTLYSYGGLWVKMTEDGEAC